MSLSVICPWIHSLQEVKKNTVFSFVTNNLVDIFELPNWSQGHDCSQRTELVLQKCEAFWIFGPTSKNVKIIGGCKTNDLVMHYQDFNVQNLLPYFWSTNERIDFMGMFLVLNISHLKCIFLFALLNLTFGHIQEILHFLY